MGSSADIRPFKPGDLVIYRCEKRSFHPGSHAEQVEPERNGEGYHYFVTKYWRVESVEHGTQVRLRTRRGKVQVVDSANPLLRHASWWERLRYRTRFPSMRFEGSVQPKLRPATES